MLLVKIKLILEITWLTLEIAILVKNNFLKPKRHKKNRRSSGKDKRR
ncbi:MAG: hypothetical protein J6S85_10445 [Methanobrevibacter sp.]|nr:hypothetical protein [Methanobrevibacter sp.]